MQLPQSIQLGLHGVASSRSIGAAVDMNFGYLQELCAIASSVFLGLAAVFLL